MDDIEDYILAEYGDKLSDTEEEILKQTKRNRRKKSGEAKKIDIRRIGPKPIPCESNIIMRVSREYLTKHGKYVFIAVDWAEKQWTYVTYIHIPLNRCPELWMRYPSFKEARLGLIDLLEK